MRALSLTEVAAAVDGRVVNTADDPMVTGEAFVDSRSVVPGGLFVAVPGERVDGHDYAASAVEAGAAAALVSHPVGVPAVVVDDTVAALGRLARHVLGLMANLCVIALTGSQGKTGTKDLMAQVLDTHGPTVATAGNQNNEIGVPLTVLRAGEETRFLLIEMGARGHGHIAYLSSIACPSVGLVLNVGVAHLGEFGTREDIAAAKGELIEALPPSGRAVLNADDDLVMGMRARTAAPLTTFGTGEDADVRYTDVTLDADAHTRFHLHHAGQRQEVTLRLVGEHQAANAAAAAAVAVSLGLPLADVAAALGTATARSRWRMEVQTTPDGVTVINDAYNASPDSMRAGLRTLVDLAERHNGGRTFAVLGEMAELGTAAESEHDAVGALVAQLGVRHLVVVGDAAQTLYAGARHDPSWSGEAVWVPDRSAAMAYLRPRLHRDDVVLVKASRAVGLEQLALDLCGADSVEDRR